VAQILVRDIEDDVKARLQRRAARHGQSMEAEVRDILRDVVKEKEEEQDSARLGTRIASRFKGIGLRQGEEIEGLNGFPITSPFDE
jgi:antitoxin FitA